MDVSVTITNVNEAPLVDGIPDVYLSTLHMPWMIDHADFFTDPDGDSLSYEISDHANTDVAHAAVDTDTLSITPVGHGVTSFLVVAVDTSGLSVSGEVSVSVTESTPVPTPAPARVTVPVPTSTPAPVVVVDAVPVPTPEPVVAQTEVAPSYAPLSERRWRNLSQQPDAVSKVIVTFVIEPVEQPMGEVILPPMETPARPKYVTLVDDIAAGSGPGPLWVASVEGGAPSIWLIMLLVLIAMLTAGYAARMYVIHRL